MDVYEAGHYNRINNKIHTVLKSIVMKHAYSNMTIAIKDAYDISYCMKHKCMRLDIKLTLMEQLIRPPLLWTFRTRSNS